MEPARTGVSPDIVRAAEVTLDVPAQGEFLTLIRTTTAAVAARMDLTIDEIEDLRIAVDEAAALLLPTATEDARVRVTFTVGPDELVISLATPTADGEPFDRSGFGWTVLAALAGSVHSDVADGISTIVLTHRRAVLGH